MSIDVCYLVHTVTFTDNTSYQTIHFIFSNDNRNDRSIYSNGVKLTQTYLKSLEFNELSSSHLQIVFIVPL